VNVLKSHLRITIAMLLANGASQREIERRTGVDRKTIRRYAGQYAANSPGVATGSDGHGELGVRAAPGIYRGASPARA
jgi:transposase